MTSHVWNLIHNTCLDCNIGYKICFWQSNFFLKDLHPMPSMVSINVNHYACNFCINIQFRKNTISLYRNKPKAKCLWFTVFTLPDPTDVHNGHLLHSLCGKCVSLQSSLVGRIGLNSLLIPDCSNVHLEFLSFKRFLQHY